MDCPLSAFEIYLKYQRTLRFTNYKILFALINDSADNVQKIEENRKLLTATSMT